MCRKKKKGVERLRLSPRMLTLLRSLLRRLQNQRLVCLIVHYLLIVDYNMNVIMSLSVLVLDIFYKRLLEVLILSKRSILNVFIGELS